MLREKKLIFWNTWTLREKIGTWLAVGAALLLVALTIYYYLNGESLVFPDAENVYLRRSDYTLDTFTKGLFSFDIKADAYTINKDFSAMGYFPFQPISYFMLVVFGVVLVYAFAAITDYQSYTYYAAISLLLVAVSLMNWDSLAIFGLHGRYVTTFILGFLALSNYTIHSLSEGMAFWKRISIYALFFGLMFYLAGWHSTEPLPFYHFATRGIWGIGMFILGFILITSIQIPMMAFVALSKRPSEGFSNIIAFLVIGVLYAVNLGLLWSNSKGYLMFDTILVHPVIIFFLSSLVGIWGVWYNGKVGNTLQLRSTGFFLYLLLMLLSFSFFAAQYSSENQAMISLLENTIIFIHFGYAAFFILYLWSNFFDLMDKKLDLGKVVFEARRMPVLFIHGFAAMTVLGLSFQENFTSFELGKAASLNLKGDYYYTAGNFDLAKMQFQNAKLFNNLDNKANYALAEIYLKADLTEKAKRVLELSLRSDPMVPAALRASNLYWGPDGYYDAQFNNTLAMRKYPQDFRLCINRAKLYESKEFKDSVVRYYALADAYNPESNVALLNMISFGIKFEIPLDSLVIRAKERVEKDKLLANNLLAYANYYKKDWEIRSDTSWLPNSDLSSADLALLSNLVFSTVKKDSSLLPKIKYYDAKDTSYTNYEQFNFLKAMMLHYHGDKLMAMNTINDFWSSGSMAGYRYGNVLALWLLEEDQYADAAVMFDRLSRSDNETLQSYINYCKTEAGYFMESFMKWKELAQSDDPSIASTAKQMVEVMSAAFQSELKTYPEEHQYLFLRQKKSILPSDSAWTLYARIRSPYLQHLALVELMDLARLKSDSALAETVLKKAKQIEGDSNRPAFNLSYLQYLDGRGELNKLEKAMATMKLPAKASDTLYFKARIAEVNGLGEEKTVKAYKKALLNNPFNVQYLRNMLGYLNQHDQRTFAYDKLTLITRLASKNNEIQKFYVWQCALQGQSFFAESTLEDLRLKLDAEAMKAVKQRYDSLLAQYYSEIQ